MFEYSKRLLFPINIKKKDLKLAQCIVTQYGGPYGELGAAIRYFNQRGVMPDERGRNLLTDIATEELGHVEMICTMLIQLTKGATLQEYIDAGLAKHYTEHGFGIFPSDVNGVPFNLANLGATGDYEADLEEDMAAEEKARVTYEHLIDLTNDPDVINVLLYLRQREVVHYARFKELRETYMAELSNKKILNKI